MGERSPWPLGRTRHVTYSGCQVCQLRIPARGKNPVDASTQGCWPAGPFRREARRAAQNRQSDQTELCDLRPAEAAQRHAKHDNMTDFMTDDTRHLGFILGERQDRASHAHIRLAAPSR